VKQENIENTTYISKYHFRNNVSI